MQDPFDALESLTDEQLLTVEQLAGRCLTEGATLADVRGYTGDEMEAVYNFAHNTYQQRRYDDARKLFQFLAENDHTEGRFWKGLAACQQMTGRHEQAVAAYGVAALLDATDPQTPLRACECYLAMDDLEGARKALDAVRLICSATGGETTHGEALKRAALLDSAIAATEAG